MEEVCSVGPGEKGSGNHRGSIPGDVFSGNPFVDIRESGFSDVGISPKVGQCYRMGRRFLRPSSRVVWRTTVRWEFFFVIFLKGVRKKSFFSSKELWEGVSV